MDLQFTKMHGLGNDFVVIDAINQDINLSSEQFAFIADRKLGIGCDQILLVESSDEVDTEFRYRIFNADGGEVEQCGNGARCFALFVRNEGLTDSEVIPVSTNSGRIILRQVENDQVQVDMGTPQLEPAKIPFQTNQQNTSYSIEYKDQTIEFSALSMGNPHAVIIVDGSVTASVDEIGSFIETHPKFPNRVNVGFMQILDRQHIKLRVFERGVGETRACGTGACAAVVAGQLRGLLDHQVTVELTGGILNIEWQGKGTSVLMTGPAESVYKGSIKL